MNKMAKRVKRMLLTYTNEDLVNTLWKSAGMRDCKAAPTQAEVMARQGRRRETVEGDGPQPFQKLVGQLRYIVADRPSLKYASKKAAREIARQ